MIVTGVPDPLMTLKDWKKIHHTIVHCLTVESKEMPVCVCVCVQKSYTNAYVSVHVCNIVRRYALSCVMFS